MRKFFTFSLKSKIAIVLILLFFTSCKPTERIVEVEKEVVKTEYKNQVFRDSIYFADTVQIDRQGDTIWITKTQYRYKDKLRVDTLFQSDTIIKTEQVIKEVNKLTGWQQLRLKLFRWLLIGFIGLLAYTFRKPIIKLIKRVIS